MKTRRVAITGMGAISPYGTGVDCLYDNLRAGRSAVSRVESMGLYGGIRSRVAGVAPPVDCQRIDRKKRRYMSPMSVFATLAAGEAIGQAGLDPERLASRMTGVSLASTMGSAEETQSFFQELTRTGGIENIKSTSFFKTMNHSCAANAAQALGINGRVISPSAACASGNLAIGLAYEFIAFGRQDTMICGGTDEYSPMATAVFDIMNAASVRYNDRPQLTPRPFDRERDGVVCAEGAGVLVLEEWQQARRRGATILGELVGFATFSSPEAIAEPDSQTMADCIEAALADAGIGPERIDYVNAHATGTPLGDVAECRSIEQALGGGVPVSSLKGHIGHTMAASGALELIASLEMMRHGVLVPTHNLEDPDPQCAGLNLFREPQPATLHYILKNSFALGGINTTVIVRRPVND